MLELQEVVALTITATECRDDLNCKDDLTVIEALATHKAYFTFRAPGAWWYTLQTCAHEARCVLDMLMNVA